MSSNQPSPPRRRGRPRRSDRSQQQNTSSGEALEREKARTERICRDLLEGYTDGFELDKERDKAAKYSESSAAKQWGINRGKMARLIEALYPNSKEKRNSKSSNQESIATPQLVPLSLSELVEILGNLAQRNSPEKPLTREDSLRLVQKFVELDPEEKAKLRLSSKNYNAVIQQGIRIIELDDHGDYLEEVLKFYDSLFEQPRNLPVAKVSEQDEIKTIIRSVLKEYQINANDETVSNYLGMVNSIRLRIETESGMNNIKTDKDRLTNQFVKSLTQSVVENAILTSNLPIFIGYFDIKKVDPLPLFLRNKNQDKELLNPFFDSLRESMNIVENQHAHTIRMNFYVKISDQFREEYKILFPEEQDIENSEVFKFYIESSGTGGKITHLARLVSLSLLKDIPCLARYFPVAHDILLVSPGVLRANNSSPLLYHTLTTLCEKKYIETALKEEKSYTSVCSNQQAFYGNYCGFDLLECAVNSTLIARLRAIKKTGVKPIEYLTQLCHRNERLDQFKKALSYLKSYPFSLLAMQSHLEKTIFHEVLASNPNQLISILDTEIESNSFQKWSEITHEAYLELIDAYLTEGLYKSAGKLIERIKSFIEDERNFEAIGSTIRTKFEICLARYFSIVVGVDEFNNPDRGHFTEPLVLVKKALSHLDNAERILEERQKKYEVINERAQSSFSPFFSLRAQISFHRAKLHLFYSIADDQSLKAEESNLPGHLNSIFLLEKARIFSGIDGDTEFYSYYSAYQAIAYIVAAFLLEENTSQFSRENCLSWAYRLIEHAVVCYSDMGNDCYQKIKEKSGIGSGESNKEDMGVRPYGGYEIQNIPSIREIPKSSEPQPFYFRNLKRSPNQNFIYLDMEALSVEANDLRIFKSTQLTDVYLFGTYACVILFARGLHILCTANTPENFFTEIELASRLFTYAWASAEDGCVSMPSDKSNSSYRLERRFFLGNTNRSESRAYNEYWEEYYNRFSPLYQQEIASIRDIYPHRVTEIADFGKIFAAVCKLLLLHCNMSTEDLWDCPKRDELETDITALLEQLHSASSKPIDEPDYRCGQHKFNEHFYRSFNRIKRYLIGETTGKLNEFISNPERLGISQLMSIRDELVKIIFRYLFEQSGRDI
ncbi:hypothetical protein H6F95_02075 [Cyanobacteria bacterium FACHB-471]|nr:hypothetical protein [Cyanobacteria bacterium FACHB-471]